MDNLFAVTAPGFNLTAERELAELGLFDAAAAARGKERAGVQGGGVAFRGDRQAVYRANLNLRTVTRVVVRLGSFYANHFAELRKKAGRLAWEQYLAPGQAVALRVSASKSRLYHTGAIAERVLGAIGDRLGQPPVEADFDERAGAVPQLVLVRFFRDRCTISVDSSGASLHRRGYRQETARAPLRETLAAGMLLASGWDGRSPLLDPFCGSGTIPIEAAMLGRRVPPGGERRFAFMDWPGFDRGLWEGLLAEAEAGVRDEAPVIQGSDRDAGAVEISQANAGRAGQADFIEFSPRAISAIEPPPGPGWVVTNPPYGVRVSANKDLRNLYAQFGNVLREKCPGWGVAFLCNDERLIRATGLELDQTIPTVNGGVPVKLAIGRVAQSNSPRSW